MDDKVERRRAQNLVAVKKYFQTHKGEIKHVATTWPIPLLRKIDEAAAKAGVSRRAWLVATCERELARLAKSRKRKSE